MNCPFCNFNLNLVDIKKLCEGCVTTKGCTMIKCPNCGYETIPDPDILKLIKKMRKEK
jgi:hypothetical protein